MCMTLLKRLGAAFGFWLTMSLMAAGGANACSDYFVCAPQDPFRHTVTQGNFTNLYLWPNPDRMTWHQYLASKAHGCSQQSCLALVTQEAVDLFVGSLVSSSYFYPLTQYHEIEPPEFSGRQRTVKECVDPVINYANTHGNLLDYKVLADFVGCEADKGGNRSDQVNVILSPEFSAQNDVSFDFPFPVGTVIFAHPPIACGSGSNIGAFHTARLGTPNFTIIPTNCNPTLDQMARGISHEMVETISNPAGMGYMHIPGGGDQFSAFASDPTVANRGELSDICEPGSVLFPQANLNVATYWSNADKNCQPAFVMTHTLVDDRTSRQFKSGDGDYQSAQVYKPPFGMADPSSVLRELLLYTETDDDNLCPDSQLDIHVLLKSGQSIDLLHVNRKYGPGGVQNTAFLRPDGQWDNNEVHTVNIPIPGTMNLKLSDIGSLGINMTSGHCTSDPFATSDKWNVKRIAFMAALHPSLVNSIMVLKNASPWQDVFGIGGSLQSSAPIVRAGGQLVISGALLFSSAVIQLAWSDPAPDIVRTDLSYRLKGNSAPPTTISLQRQPNDHADTFTPTGLTPGDTYEFQVRDCDGLTCTPYSSLLDVVAPPPASNAVTLYLDRVNPADKLAIATLDANRNFSTPVTIPSSATAGAHNIVADRGPQVPAPPPLGVQVAAGSLPATIQVESPQGDVVKNVTQTYNFTLHGFNFSPGGSVTIAYADSPTAATTGLGTAMVAADGTFVAALTAPSITVAFSEGL
jgi:hypothetical protein